MRETASAALAWGELLCQLPPGRVPQPLQELRVEGSAGPRISTGVFPRGSSATTS